MQHRITSGRGQSSLELLILTGFMFLIFLGALSIGGSHLVDLQRENDRSLILETAEYIENELQISLMAESGYIRQFKLPSRLGQADYEILVVNGSNFTEIVLQFVNYSIDFETTLIVPPNVNGNVLINSTADYILVTIRKINGFINISGGVPLPPPPNSPPMHDNPIITPSPASDDDTLVCTPQSVYDADGDDVQTITNWQKDGVSTTVLNMPFEGGSTATYTKDYSGYGNNGVVSGATWSSTGGKLGGAYMFDGVDDYIDSGSSSSIDLDGKSFTFALWLKPHSFSNKGFISKNGAYTTRQSLHITFNGADVLRFGFYSDDLDVDPNLNLDEWAYLVFTYNTVTNEQRTFVNGVGLGIRTTGGDLTNTDGANLEFGRIYNRNSEAYDGEIDEVRMYDHALSPAQVLEHYNLNYNKIHSDETSLGESWTCEVTPNDGIVDGETKNSTRVIGAGLPVAPTHDNPIITPDPAYDADALVCTPQNVQDANGDPVQNITNWQKDGLSRTVLNLPFEGGSTSTYTKDYSGYGNDGIVSGATWSRTGGRQGGAYNFYDQGDSVNLSSAPAVDPQDSWTYELWLYVRNYTTGLMWDGAGTYFIDRVVAALPLASLKATDGGLYGFQVRYDSGAGLGGPANGAIALNTWTHVAMVRDYNSNFRLYVNGVEVDQTNDDGSALTPPTAALGRHATSDTVFNGTIDEVRIYDHALSSAQVLEHYNLNYNKIHGDETSPGESWTCEVTPNDGIMDGIMKNATVVVLSSLSTKVLSVENYTLVFGDADTSVSATIVNSQNISNSVPFVTFTRDGMGDLWRNIIPQVKFLPSPDRIVASRTVALGDLTVQVTVVEFDPSSVKVQTGTFLIADDESEGDLVTIPEAVTVANSALVFYWLSDDNGDDYDVNLVLGNISSTTQINFTRTHMPGKGNSLVTGTWFIFESLDGSFTTQTAHISLTGTSTSGTATISSVDTSKTFLIASTNCNLHKDDSVTCAAVVNLTDSTTITAHRGNGATPGSETVGINVQAITFSGDETVQRGSLSYGAGTATDTDSISEVDLNAAMPWSPTLIGIIESNSNAAGALESSFQRLKFTSTTTVQGIRGQINGSAHGIYEIIEWVVVGGGNSAPTHDNPIITPATAYTSDTLTCTPQNVYDADGDPVQNITNWQKDGVSTTRLFMPFEGGSTDAYTKDYSGYSNDGTVVGATWSSTSGRQGGAYTFIAANSDGIDLGNPASLQLTGAITLSAWVKFSGFGYNSRIVTKSGVSGSRGWDMAVDLNDNRVEFKLSTDGSTQYEVRSANPLTAGVWYHLVGVYEPSVALRLYVDGGLSNQNTASIPAFQYNTGNNVAIGNRAGCGNCDMNGIIDEVRVYNYAMSANQVLEHYNLNYNKIHSDETSTGDSWTCEVTPNDGFEDGTTKNATRVIEVMGNAVPTHTTPVITPNPAYTADTLVCTAQNVEDLNGDPVQNITNWYKDGYLYAHLILPFEGGSSSTHTEDYSGNAYDGTVNGGATWSRTGGRQGGGYILDGVDDYIEVGSINPSDAISVELWVKSNNAAEYTGVWQIISKYNAYILGTGAYGSKQVCFIIMNGTNWEYGTCYTPSDVTVWHHFVGTYDRATGDKLLYVDGILRASTNLGSRPAIAPDSGPIHIGQRECCPGDNLNAAIDEVRIYEHALSPGEVWEHYNLRYNQIHGDETTDGELWECEVVPNDGYVDGTLLSTTRTITPNTPPSLSVPNILPTTAYTDDTLTCTPPFVQDVNGNPVETIFNWKKDSVSITQLNYPFEGASGSESTTTLDYSGYNRDGSVNGAVWGRTTGIEGGAYRFTNAPDYINTNIDFSWGLSDSFTIEFWINPSSVTGTQGIMGKGDVGVYGPLNWEWSVRMTDSTIDFVYWNSVGGGEIYLSSTVTTYTWDHFAVTYDPVNKARLYKNGVLVYSDNAVTSALQNRGTPMLIGHAYYTSGTNYYFKGFLDNVRVYNRALSANQVWEHSNLNYNILRSDETSGGDDWTCGVTPNDGYDDGIKGSAVRTITTLNSPPTHNNPYISPSPAYTDDYLVCVPQNVQDADGDTVQTITNWYGQDQIGDYVSQTVLNMPFEGGSTSVYTKDYSGGNDGTITGATWSSTSGRLGGAYQFDGLDDFITVTDNDNLDIGTSGITVSAWVNLRDSSKSWMVFGKGTSQPGTYYIYDHSSQGMKFSVWGASGSRFDAVSPVNDISENTWHFLVGTYDESTVKLYVDGVLLDSTPASANLGSNSNDLLIGKYQSGGYFVDGTIDEVRIYDYALSHAQILEHYDLNYNKIHSDETATGDDWTCEVTPNDGTVDGMMKSSLPRTITATPNSPPTHGLPGLNPATAYDDSNLFCIPNSVSDPDGDPVQTIINWRIDNVPIAMLNMPFEGTANPAFPQDYSGNNLDGTVTGAVWSSTSGKVGGAYTFNGNDYIDIPASSVFDVQRLTIEAWVYSSNFARNMFIFEKGSVNTQYSLFFEGTKMIFRTFNYMGTQQDFSAEQSFLDINQNQWNHVAATYDGTYKKLYVNGILKATLPYSETLRTGLGTASRIGAYGGGSPNYYFDGIIDEVRVYNRALSDNQIWEHFYLLNSNRIIRNENTAEDETWMCEVTPNDGQVDGFMLSAERYITPVGNVIPTHDDPTISPVPAYTSSILTCNAQNVYDYNGDGVRLIYSWKKNGLNDAVLQLPFEGGSTSSMVYDYSGESNHCFGYGSPAPLVSMSAGRQGYGGAYFGSAKNAWFDCGTSSKLSFNRDNPYTLEAWIKTANEANQAAAIMAKMNPALGARGYDMFINNNKIRAHLINTWSTNAIAVDGSTIINDMNWHHVVITYDGSSSVWGLKIYVDGSQDSLTHVVDTLTSSTTTGVEFRVGSREGQGFYHGYLDEVRVYDRQLSLLQIYRHYYEQYNKIRESETTTGDDWKCYVTPNDGKEDGDTKFASRYIS